MFRHTTCATVAALVVLLGSIAWGQFAGPAFFSTAPTSQLGPVTNNLVLTNTANGFTVTGQALVSTSPAPPTGAGILIEWVVDRPLAPSFTFSNWMTTTQLVGFSQPPIGAAGNTAGQVTTEFTEPLMQPASLSSYAMTLTNGMATWSTGPINSGTFSGATPASPTYYLRQHFFLDGIYLNGPGGTWTVDVPLDSYITQVPEPGMISLLSLVGLFAVTRRGVRRT